MNYKIKMTTWLKYSVISFCLLFTLGCKKKGDIQFLEDSGDWKIEKMEVRTTDLDGNLVVEQRTDFQYFRLYNVEKLSLFGGFTGTYTGKIFEIESFVDSTLNTPSYTLKWRYCLGNYTKMEYSEDYVFNEGIIDPSKVYLAEASFLEYSNSFQDWILSLYNPISWVTFRKLEKNKMRVIITKQSPGSGEILLDIVKV